MRVKEILQRTKSNYRRDGELILSHLMGISVSQLPLYFEEEVPEEIRNKFFELLDERKRGKPVAYIIGEWECMGRVFKVKEGVLIPRPETEILIEKTLELIPLDKEQVGFELGSGSGCISVNLLVERPKLRMWTVDINVKAVEITKENAKLHNVSDRLTVLHGYAFEPVKGMKFDFIVSNPPYIPERYWSKLAEEVKIEGYTSLIGGKKGYEFYELIAGESDEFLKPKGFIALEIGHDQGEIVRAIFESKGFNVIVFKDYANYDRVIVAKKWN
ncbi:MAG TPA: peptide chain release factor N(5)-glutamine methyltransferase [Aquifex aeolicus]|nr:peptide chain release factor N(5)-glutamine methyltransferase [Aquifex aeolicus]